MFPDTNTVEPPMVHLRGLVKSKISSSIYLISIMKTIKKMLLRIKYGELLRQNYHTSRCAIVGFYCSWKNFSFDN